MSLRLSRIAIRWRCVPLSAWISVVLFWSVAVTPTTATAGPMSASHSAILLAKCLPYNESWEENTSLEILVLAVGTGAAATSAEEFAGSLVEVGSKLRAKDPGTPRYEVTTSTLRQFDLSTLATVGPHLIYLTEGQGRASGPLREPLIALAEEAKRLGILVFTDSRSAYRDAASIYFTLSDESRPEIYGNLDRVRDQGGQLQGTFQRLLRQEVGS